MEDPTEMNRDIEDEIHEDDGDYVHSSDDERVQIVGGYEEERVSEFQCNDGDPIIPPTIGKVFTSTDEAYESWKFYALRMGFATHRRTSHKFHGQQYRATFTCSRGRNPKASSLDLILPAPIPTKPPTVARLRKSGNHYTNCHARMIINDPMLDGTWTITNMELEHNHELQPKSVKFWRCHKRINGFIDSQLEINDRAGVPQSHSISAIITQSGGYQNAMCTERDLLNRIQLKRNEKLANGDANQLMRYFHMRQSQTPSFFYTCEFSEDGCLSAVFWADARTRAAYRYFGDVISFDTTYLTNKYEMPFAPFIGINQHGQSILLGCALLPNELTETYIWLFKTWLSCMGDAPPKAIISDQCGAICTAIQTVFPNTRHRLCLWHILNKLPTKIGKGPAWEPLHDLIRSIVHQSQTPVEFENKWTQLLEEIPHGAGRDWLRMIYGIRNQWVPAFLNNHFWAGMNTTQRSEGINAFFDKFVNSRTPLITFAERYDAALQHRWEKEREEDFKGFNKSPILASKMPCELQFANLYSPRMFYAFQAELAKLIDHHCIIGLSEGPRQTYIVSEYGRSKQTHVTIDPLTNEYECPCNLFNFRGIICCHALCVYRQLRVREVPEKYVLNRWRKDAARTHALENANGDAVNTTLGQYDGFYTLAHSKLLNLVELCNLNPKFAPVILNGLDKLTAEVSQKLETLAVQPASDIETPQPRKTYKNPKTASHPGRPRKNRFKQPTETSKKVGKKRPSKFPAKQAVKTKLKATTSKAAKSKRATKKAKKNLAGKKTNHLKENEDPILATNLDSQDFDAGLTTSEMISLFAMSGGI